jgi:hypothetical protein
MENSFGLIPIVSCAVVVGILWKRDGNGDGKLYNVKKKYWYAFMESLFVITGLIIFIKKLS